MTSVDELQNRPRQGDPELPAAVDAVTKAGAGQSPTQSPDGSPLPVFNLITEAEAYRIYGHLLEDKELRRARAAGLIGYLRRKRTIHYRRDELDSFVNAAIQEGYIPPCRAPEPRPSTPPRMTLPKPMPPASVARPAVTGTIPDETFQRAADRLRRRPFATR